MRSNYKLTLLNSIRSFFSLLTVLTLFSCSQPENSELLLKLDEVLENRSVYDGYFRDGVKVLKDVLAEQKEPVQRYNISLRIGDSYRTNSLDSSLTYLRLARDIAVRLQDENKVSRADFEMAKLYVKAGFMVESDDILNRYRNKQVNDDILAEYCQAEHTYWGEAMAYTSTSESYGQKLEKRDYYRDILLTLTEEGSWEWCNLKREEADENSDKDLFSEYAQKMLNVSKENSREYAEAAYYYAHSLRRKNAQAGYEEWMLRSAIADMMCSTKDYASLNEISYMLFDKGDIDRAFHYAADHCMVDALHYNGKLRPWQILVFFPHIENAYQEKHAQQNEFTLILLACISALFFLMLILIAFLIKRQQILNSTREKLQDSYLEIDRRNHELEAVNSRLVSLNAQMRESDKVKQEYIALFLGMLSDNISSSRQYRNKVLKYIRQGKTKELVEEIENLPTMGDDILEFYRMFDQTFVNLYPDFIRKFNELLADGEEIVPKSEDILTPELRVFALIKLGITESSRIASLLHYSANTIYNYRAKIKNKARGSRDDFEEAVKNID